MQIILDNIILLIPIYIIQLGIQIYATINLVKQESVRFNNKVIWAVIIWVLGIIGAIVYLIAGRESK